MLNQGSSRFIGIVIIIEFQQKFNHFIRWIYCIWSNQIYGIMIRNGLSYYDFISKKFRPPKGKLRRIKRFNQQ